jgi:hypothetical protein
VEEYSCGLFLVGKSADILFGCIEVHPYSMEVHHSGRSNCGRKDRDGRLADLMCLSAVPEVGRANGIVIGWWVMLQVHVITADGGGAEDSS